MPFASLFLSFLTMQQPVVDLALAPSPSMRRRWLKPDIPLVKLQQSLSQIMALLSNCLDPSNRPVDLRLQRGDAPTFAIRVSSLAVDRAVSISIGR